MPDDANNLLVNGGFESGLNGWTVNTSAGLGGATPPAYLDGSDFASGHDALAWAEQTVDLLAAGYTAAQLDSADWVVVFGGRIRALTEDVKDRAMLQLTFLDENGDQLGSTIEALATNTTDRWELVGDRAYLPAGTRSMSYRFEAFRETRPNNDSFLDGAFLFVQPDTVMPDQGAYGNTIAEQDQSSRAHLALRFPDLYTDWELAARHTIRWDSFNNADETTVRIDVYQDSAQGPQFLLNITEGTLDDGEFDWIPQNTPLPNGTYLTYGTHGLHLRISLVGDDSVIDQSTEPFSIPENGNDYYVDDASDVNDEYTPNATGSNRNTGKLPEAPKPLLPTVLRIYDLGDESTVYVDDGSYLHFHQIVLSGNLALNDDEGLTITGPTGTGRATNFNYAFPDERLVWVDVNDGDWVTLRYLTFTGGAQGIWVHNASTQFVGQHLSVSGAAEDGIRLESDAVNAVLEDSQSFNNGGVGIYVGRAIERFEANEVYGNASGIVVENNLSAPAVIGNYDLSLNRGNQVHDNTTVGIQATGNVQVFGNAISGQTTTGAAGLILTGTAQAARNVVQDNYDGIVAGDGTSVSENRIADNSRYGLIVSGNVAVSANAIYGNATGIEGERFIGTITNNLVYANADNGVLLRRSFAVQIVNNTIYQPTGNAVTIEGDATGGSEDIELRNNILWVDSGFAISVTADSQLGFASDFNLLRVTGTGQVAHWQDVDYPTLFDWQNAAFTDRLSLSDDPLFVDADGADNVLGTADDDFHLQSTAGSFHGGALAPVINAGTGLPEFPAATLTSDAAQSPGIDRGDDADAFNQEPSFNGGFINLGVFGNTAQASKSPTEYVMVLVPNGGEQWLTEHTNTILWRSHNTVGTVKIELWQTGGASAIATIQSSTANDGEFAWDIPNNLSTNTNYLIRVLRNDASAKDDFSNQPFTITATLHFYYVNDGAFAVGDWTLAAGDEANDGLSPATPKASIRAVLEAYDLGANDVIRVDAGAYVLATNILLTANDAGVTIEGYANPAFPDRQTVLDRGNTSLFSYVFELQNADNVTLRQLHVTGGQFGVFIGDGSDSDDVTIADNEFFGLTDSGIYVGRELGGLVNDRTVITGNEFHDNRYGLRSYGAQTLVGTMVPVASDVRWAPAGVTGTGVFADGNLAYNNESIGLAVYGPDAYVGGNIARDNLGIGIGAYSERSTVQANTVHDNAIGLDLRANNALATGNSAYANDHGIWARADVATSVKGNFVFLNRLTGITAVDVVRVENNVVTQQNLSATNVGISLTGSAEAVSNQVYQNSIGLEALTGSTVTTNRVYANGTGIHAITTAQVNGNFVYSNTTGIRADTLFSGQLTHNIVYDNSSAAIELADVRGATLLSNTIYQTSGDAVRVLDGSENVQLRNNILWAGSGFALSVTADSQTGFDSDYNLFFTSFPGRLAQWGNLVFAQRAAWFYELGFDRHSLTANPLFVNPAGADGLLGFNGGMDRGMDDDFHVQSSSPAVDAGDLANDFSNEPMRNGGRVNLGAYGNTTSATTSPMQYVQVLTPTGLEKFEAGEMVTVLVRTYGLAGSDTLSLEVSSNNGMNWTTLTSTLALDPLGQATFTWFAGPVTEANSFLIRATANVPGLPQDVLSDAFLVTNSGSNFYVNDSSTLNDEFTTATGNNANSGKQTDHPMASLRALLLAYDLDTGDLVQVDVGQYALAANVNITAQDSGVRIEGPMNHPAVLDRQSTGPGAAVIELVDADNVTVQRLNLTGGRYGVWAGESSDSDDVELSDNVIYGSTEAGIYFGGNAQVSSDRLQILRNQIYGDGMPTGQLVGLDLRYSQDVTVNGNTVRDHAREGMQLADVSGLVNLNEVHHNAVGILASGGAVLLSLSANQVYDNVWSGIRATGNVEVIGNEVYGHIQGVGIETVGGTVSQNTVYDNQDGIAASDGTTVTGNRVYHNTDTGIRAEGSGDVLGNTIYSNGVGLAVTVFTGSLANNLVYANSVEGIVLTAATDVSVTNNTVYQLAGDAVQLTGNSRDVQLRNNILWVSGGYAMSIADDSQVGFDSDYSLLFTTGAGKLALWGSFEFIAPGGLVLRIGLRRSQPDARPATPLIRMAPTICWVTPVAPIMEWTTISICKALRRLSMRAIWPVTLRRSRRLTAAA